MADRLKHRRQIDALAEILDDKGLTEIEYEAEGVRIRLARGGAPVPMPAAPAAMQVAGSASAAAGDAAAEDASHIVKSPMVGTFYTAASPESKPFVAVGDRVTKGQVLCIIEAMKLMNEIEADCSGVLAERLAENAQGVEFEQPLFRIAVD